MSCAPYPKLQATPDFASFQFTSPVQPEPVVRQVRFIRDVPDLYVVDVRNKTQVKEDPAWVESTDFRQVVATVTQIIEVYSERYPRRIFRFCGDSRLKDLVFRTMLNRYYGLLAGMFEIASDQCVLYRGPGHDQPMPFNMGRKPIPYLTINTIRNTQTGVSRMFKSTFTIETDRNVRVGLTLPPV
ncbi:MAG TPA: hypothetical protein VN616_05120 [Puia sp.]|nr:hypothetical protein [Puia sp.]